MTYDAWNRVVRITDNETALPEPNTLGVYAYDARGSRITQNTYDAGAAQKRIDHYYTSTWQCIEEREVDLTVTQPASEALRAQYVWGLRYIDDLIQRQRDTTGNGILDETLYAMSDRQFNVVALSDTSQSVVQRFAYTPYGQATFLTSTYGSSTNTKDWEHLFQGLRLDNTRFYENRARLLDPLTGRFLQRDPQGYIDGMNLYAAYYVMYGDMDPSGMGRTKQPSPRMTCAKARRIVREQIKKWEESEYMYAARLLQHFLDNKGKEAGDYTVNEEDVEEVQEHAKDNICAIVANKVCAGENPIDIEHEEGEGSNIRWMYIGHNKNMLYAFGGADMDIKGGVTWDGIEWSGTFTVKLSDEYEFDKSGFFGNLKQFLSETWSDAYRAAVYLEQNCGNKTFSHEVNFTIDCSGCCTTSGEW